ncbi:MAG: hypothetical protein QOD06_2167, partial [Candidatus Binatota bacterium]|nr:hypothetical protein [Candidatus Binatota bacterium]
AELPFYTVDLPYLWGRRLASGGMVFGSGLAFDATGDLTRISLSGEDPVNALERLIARVRDLHPALARTRIAHRWAGPIAFTDDRRPVIGRHPTLPGVLVAGAYAGHGVALGVHAGCLIAGAILDGRDLPLWGALD